MRRTKNNKFYSYYKAIEYLEGLNNIFGSYQKTNLTSHPNPEMFIKRMQDFLDQIGNPEKDFKYIHITGTAGKGSVSSIIHTTLFKDKKKTGLFTSPFVTSTIEKIQVNNKYIDPITFSDIVEYLKPFIDKATIYGQYGMPSYFEIIFAIALIYFKKENCEYVVLEVGLGGRYDATNIIKNPLITAITNIDLDHTQILGTTKDKIAEDKAGIIKKDSHFFTTEDNTKLLSIFEKECKKQGAIYNKCDTNNLDYLEKNKALAGRICFDIGIIKDINNINQSELLPARFEIIEKKPLIILDGAHNVSKIQTTIYNLNKIKYNKLSVILTISADKDWKFILDIILPKVNKLYITRFSTSGRQCINPKDIFEYSQKYLSKNDISYFSDSREVFYIAKKSLSREDVLLITGSFYLAGDIRKLYCSEDKILEQRNCKI